MLIVRNKGIPTMKCLIKYLEEWWRKFMLYWIKWIWEMEGNYVGKESNEGSSQMRQWIDEIGIGPLVLNVTIHLSIQSNSWGFAPQSKNDSLSFQNRFGMMKIYVRCVEYLQTQLVQHDWSHMTRGGRWTSLDASFARCFAIFWNIVKTSHR